MTAMTREFNFPTEPIGGVTPPKYGRGALRINSILGLLIGTFLLVVGIVAKQGAVCLIGGLLLAAGLVGIGMYLGHRSTH